MLVDHVENVVARVAGTAVVLVKYGYQKGLKIADFELDQMNQGLPCLMAQTMMREH